MGGGEVREGMGGGVGGCGEREGREEGVTEWELLPIRSARCVGGET